MALNKQTRNHIAEIKRLGGDHALARAHAEAAERTRSVQFGTAAASLERHTNDFYNRLSGEVYTLFDTASRRLKSGESQEDVDAYIKKQVDGLHESYIRHVDEPSKRAVKEALTRIGALWEQANTNPSLRAQNTNLSDMLGNAEAQRVQLQAEVERLQAEPKVDLVAEAIARALKNYVPPAIPMADKKTLDYFAKL